MKDLKVRQYEEKRIEILEQIKKKQKNSSKIFDKSKMERESRATKISRSMQSEQIIKTKMDSHYENLENERLEVEKGISYRCKNKKI